VIHTSLRFDLGLQAERAIRWRTRNLTFASAGREARGARGRERDREAEQQKNIQTQTTEAGEESMHFWPLLRVFRHRFFSNGDSMDLEHDDPFGAFPAAD